jgi:hypothetical protein
MFLETTRLETKIMKKFWQHVVKKGGTGRSFNEDKRGDGRMKCRGKWLRGK